MAEGSKTTIALDLAKLPLLPGVADLVRKGYFTRARVSNRTHVEKGLRIEGTPDPVLLEVFFDAQTSGGLLISVPAERAEQLVQACRSRGTLVSVVIGEVRNREEVSLVVHCAGATVRERGTTAP
jgi:selenide,water dikinase